jgi:hypothetical protein
VRDRLLPGELPHPVRGPERCLHPDVRGHQVRLEVQEADHLPEAEVRSVREAHTHARVSAVDTPACKCSPCLLFSSSLAELVCERPACDTRARKDGTGAGCCDCANQANLAATIRAANSLVEESSEVSAMMPSFMEVMHTIKAAGQQGEKMCCKCAA